MIVRVMSVDCICITIEIRDSDMAGIRSRAIGWLPSMV